MPFKYEHYRESSNTILKDWVYNTDLKPCGNCKKIYGLVRRNADDQERALCMICWRSWVTHHRHVPVDQTAEALGNALSETLAQGHESLYTDGVSHSVSTSSADGERYICGICGEHESPTWYHSSDPKQTVCDECYNFIMDK